eukprot:Gb_29759 [translate_table: standard]
MSKVDWKKLRPMILERVKQRVKDYPIKSMIPVAHDVLNARAALIEGVSKLLKVIPVKACRHCSEVHVGHIGHRIRTCRGHNRGVKNLVHEWIEGGINDILVPVESFHLHDMFQNVIEHGERFDFDRIPSVVELCIQAGVNLNEYLSNRTNNSINLNGLIFDLSDHKSDTVSEILMNTKDEVLRSSSVLVEEQCALAQRTLQAWEMMRLETQQLMLVYPVKVCQHCPEVHVGPFGHKVQLCGPFNYQASKGEHRWKRADMDDLIPPKNVWHVRPHDVPPLMDKWRGYYGHAPAVVELCVQAGAAIPIKYHCMMKINGLAPSSDYLFLFLFCSFLLWAVLSIVLFSHLNLPMHIHLFKSCMHMYVNI